MADTALATFNTAIGRARYLLKMYHGLINTRQRGIRADWAGSFCTLMHWPQNSDIARVDSKDAVVVLRDGAALDEDDFTESQLSDLLRASIVMAVSALDAYFHSKTLAFIVKSATKGDSMPKSLSKATITVADFVGATRFKRRNQGLRNAFQRSLGFQSLQQPKNIEDALSLIGIEKFWSGVAARIGNPVEDIKKELTQIVKRRNQIAHEGDLSQSKKARNKPHDITPGLVQSSLDFLDQLIKTAELEINNQLGV